MGELINMRGSYKNKNAVSNVIKYVTRKRENETRSDELIGYGAVGTGNYITPAEMIQRFNVVQKLHGINYRKGRRIFHEVFSITDDEFKQLGYCIDTVNQMAFEMCMEYFNNGFQAIYGIHWEETKKLHIHFAVNSVSFMTGKKFDTSVQGNLYRNQKFNLIMKSYCKYRPAIYFYSDIPNKQKSNK